MLPVMELIYQTWGELNAEKDNAILLFHALSGSHNAAGYTPSIGDSPFWEEEMQTGWWEDFIGEGKALDTSKYCVICANYLGGCYGSTGPSSLNPMTGKPYGATFPRLAISDQVHAQAELVKSLGINRLAAVMGPSMGGLMSVSFATLYPQRVERVIAIASGMRTTVLNRLILFEQILAIENDPHFNGGDYYEGSTPDYGLALARMISHKTFVHLDAIERRAKKEFNPNNASLAWYRIQDNVQSYMLHQGQKFVKRFDANTYLRLIDMWSRYDPCATAGKPDNKALFTPCKTHGHRFLIFSIDSDFCFYPEEQAAIVSGLEQASVEHMHITVHSDKGHDSFLLEPELYTPHIRYLLG